MSPSRRVVTNAPKAGSSAAVKLVWAILTICAVVAAGFALRPAAAKPAGGIGAVFYSGAGCAGLPQAGNALRRLRAQPGPCIPGVSGGTGFYNGRWTSSTKCDPSHATFPSVIDGTTISQLVGYSLGRLGPLYFLQAAGKDEISKISYIVMLDPGSSEITSNDCDTGTDLNAAGRLRDWLGANDANRLLIMAGPDTSAGNYAGINKVYLRDLGADVLDGKVFVCSVDLAHHEVMSRYASLIGSAFSGKCPEGSERANRAPPPTPATPPGAGASGNASTNSAPALPVVVPAAASVGLSQGPTAPDGYRYGISLRGFPPGSSVPITCHDSASPAGFYSFRLTVDGSGAASTASYCYSADGPDHWVVAGGIESNHVSWGGGAGRVASTPPRTAPPTTLPPPTTIAQAPVTTSPPITTARSIPLDPATTSPLPATTTPPARPATYPETTGGAANTWTNFRNAGGAQGPTIAKHATVQIACKVAGFKVQSGNTWWYRIASSPWDNRFYVSADAFYNNGATSGDLKGTPFVDPQVPDC